MSHVVIFNRSALADGAGWIHIVPRGELPNSEAGIVQVLDEPALDAILAGIAKQKNRLGDKWPGLYAGREHFIYNSEQDSEALAWFKDFEKRADGIWAKADGLTDIGREAITNRRYKFTSFVADRGDLKKLDGNRYRVLAIETVGFTNQANGKELLTPILNRSEPFPARAGAQAESQPQPHKQTMKTIATELGLSADAAEDAVLAEVRKLKNRVTTLEPLSSENTTLKTENQTLLGEQCDVLMDAHGIKADDKVRNRLKPVLIGLKSREDRAAALGEFGFKPVEAKAAAGAQRKLQNRDTKAPGGSDDPAATGDEQAIAQKQNVEINSYKLKNRCTYEQARNAVRLEKPELFGVTGN